MMEGKACVLIHGFTGSPKEIELIAEHLRKRGIQVITPVLPGHGESLNRKEMRKYNRKDWIDTAEKAVKEMVESYQEVYLIGFSMGGLISSYLASKYPIKKLVLLSASVYYMNVKRFSADFRIKLRNRSQLQRYLYKMINTPVRATIQFRKLVQDLIPYIGCIENPVLIIQGEKDDLVDPKSAEYIYDTVRSKEKYLHLLPQSKHIVCWDSEKEQVVELIDRFLFSNLTDEEVGDK